VAAFLIGFGPVDIGPASRDLEDAVAAYRAEGLPWEAKDLQPNPPLSEDENAAPLIEKAMPSFDFNSEVVLHDTTAMAESAETGDFKALATELGPYDSGLDLAARATKMKGADFHYDWDLEPYVQFPQLYAMKTMAFCFGFRARLAASRGDVSGAASNLECALKLADFSGQIPSLFGMLVEIREQDLVFLQYTRCAALFKDNPKALHALEKSISAYRSRGDLLFALRGEAYTGIVLFRNFDNYGGLTHFIESITSTEAPPGVGPKEVQRTGLATGLWSRAFMDRQLRFWTASIQALKKGHYTATALSAVGASEKGGNKAWSMRFADMLMPEYPEIGEEIRKTDAWRETAKALISALEVRARTGKMPTSIAEVPGSWIDPFDGKPLRLWTDGATIRIYSLGSNLKDYKGLNAMRSGKSDSTNIGAVYPPYRGRWEPSPAKRQGTRVR